MIYTGDCIEVMQTLDPDSIDAVVTDPPYGLEFMGKEWDKPNGFDKRTRDNAGAVTDAYARLLDRGPMKYVAGHAFQAWCEAWGRAALRVTKPGGYLLAFGGTRTHHRLVCGLEDAGWIIRDELDWIYASGFPKGKANLKPAHEPIVLARKPGPLRPLAIDDCRIGPNPGYSYNADRNGTTFHGEQGDRIKQTAEKRGADVIESQAGRWPSNVLLSDPALFDTANPDVVGSGAVTSSTEFPTRARESNDRQVYEGGVLHKEYTGGGFADSGGYSRFFGIPQGPDATTVEAEQGGLTTTESDGTTGQYPMAFIVPKADRADREPVLRGQLVESTNADYQPTIPVCECGNRTVITGAGKQLACGHPSEMYHFEPTAKVARENSHPTVKPVDLMRHLVRLVTPVGGTVLDCFLGSGSTALAAETEGFAWIGIEKEPEYVAIAEARLNGVQRGIGL